MILCNVCGVNHAAMPVKNAKGKPVLLCLDCTSLLGAVYTRIAEAGAMPALQKWRERQRSAGK